MADPLPIGLRRTSYPASWPRYEATNYTSTTVEDLIAEGVDPEIAEEAIRNLRFKPVHDATKFNVPKPRYGTGTDFPKTPGAWRDKRSGSDRPFPIVSRKDLNINQGAFSPVKKLWELGAGIGSSLFHGGQRAPDPLTGAERPEHLTEILTNIDAGLGEARGGGRTSLFFSSLGDWEKEIAKPFRQNILGGGARVASGLGIMSPEAANQYYWDVGDNPSLLESLVDPFPGFLGDITGVGRGLASGFGALRHSKRTGSTLREAGHWLDLQKQLRGVTAPSSGAGLFSPIKKMVGGRRDLLKGGLAAAVGGGLLGRQQAIKSAAELGDPKARMMLEEILRSVEGGVDPSVRGSLHESLASVLRGGGEGTIDMTNVPFEWRPGSIEHAVELDPVQYKNMDEFINKQLLEVDRSRWHPANPSLDAAWRQEYGEEMARLVREGKVDLGDITEIKNRNAKNFWDETYFEDANQIHIDRMMTEFLDAGVPYDVAERFARGAQKLRNRSLDVISRPAHRTAEEANLDITKFISTIAQEGKEQFNPAVRQAILDKFALGTEMGDLSSAQLQQHLFELERKTRAELLLAKQGEVGYTEARALEIARLNRGPEWQSSRVPKSMKELAATVEHLRSQRAIVKEGGVLAESVDPSILKGWIDNPYDRREQLLHGLPRVYRALSNSEAYKKAGESVKSLLMPIDLQTGRVAGHVGAGGISQGNILRTTTTGSHSLPRTLRTRVRGDEILGTGDFHDLIRQPFASPPPPVKVRPAGVERKSLLDTLARDPLEVPALEKIKKRKK